MNLTIGAISCAAAFWQDEVFAKFSAEMELVLQRMEASCTLSTGRAAQGFGCVLWMKPLEGCAKDVVGRVNLVIMLQAWLVFHHSHSPRQSEMLRNRQPDYEGCVLAACVLRWRQS